MDPARYENGKKSCLCCAVSEPVQQVVKKQGGLLKNLKVYFKVVRYYLQCLELHLHTKTLICVLYAVALKMRK